MLGAGEHAAAAAGLQAQDPEGRGRMAPACGSSGKRRGVSLHAFRPQPKRCHHVPNQHGHSIASTTRSTAVHSSCPSHTFQSPPTPPHPLPVHRSPSGPSRPPHACRLTSLRVARPLLAHARRPLQAVGGEEGQQQVGQDLRAGTCRRGWVGGRQAFRDGIERAERGRALRRAAHKHGHLAHMGRRCVSG